MAGELLLLDHQETFFALSTDFEKICQLQLEPGKSYLVLARGGVSVVAGRLDLRLETPDAADDTSFTQGHGGPTHFEAGHSTFSLMLATRVPPDPGPDPDLFWAAMLSVRRDPNGGGGELNSIKLVALAVDHVSPVSG